MIEAVIFDLDGVLVDTEPLHLAATRALIAPAALRLEQYEQFIGRGGFKEWLEATYGIPRATIDARYTALFFVEMEQDPPQPLDGATALIDALATKGVALAVASQSSRSWVDATLVAAGLAERFTHIVTAEEAGADKPAPDVYLHAARLVGVQPAACIAVEDSIHGVASAHAAGMTVVQATQASFAQPAQKSADAVVASLRDFDLGWLRSPPGRTETERE